MFMKLFCAIVHHMNAGNGFSGSFVWLKVASLWRDLDNLQGFIKQYLTQAFTLRLYSLTL